jgi:transposase
MDQYYYVGMDIHKKIIAYCIKRADGSIESEGTIEATRKALQQWVEKLPKPWIGAMEATIFTGWIYDFLKPYAYDIQVGNPLMMRAITMAKKKNDKLDARTITDLVRCGLLPQCYMAPQEMRDLRRALRYRNLLVRQAVRMKNRASTLLMEVGAQYNKGKLHGSKYFRTLVDSLSDVPEGFKELLLMNRGALELFETCQKRLVKALVQNETLRDRVQRLMSIDGVGEVTALTWALEVAEPQRFSSIRKAISYCGLCSSQVESAGKATRMPLSKQRNKHLQTILIETSKLAPVHNQELGLLYERERQRGSNHNQATITVARKLVAYLLAVDKNERAFIKDNAAKKVA